MVRRAAGQTAAVGVHPDGTVPHRRLRRRARRRGHRDPGRAAGRRSPRARCPAPSRRSCPGSARIGDGGASTAAATVDVAGQRLDVAVDLPGRRRPRSRSSVGNPGTLGALVGLTGLEATSDARATARRPPTPLRRRLRRLHRHSPPRTGAQPPSCCPATRLLTGRKVSPPPRPIGVNSLAARIGFLGVPPTSPDVSLDARAARRRSPLDARGATTARRVFARLLTRRRAPSPRACST